MQCGKPHTMNNGTPNSSGRNLASRPHFTAVVMMNPQPMASTPHCHHPAAKRPSRMRWAVSCNGIGDTRAIIATSKHPTMFSANMAHSFANSPLMKNPAVPV